MGFPFGLLRPISRNRLQLNLTKLVFLTSLFLQFLRCILLLPVVIKFRYSVRCHLKLQIADCELWWFAFLTDLVLFKQSDYLNHSNKESDWLIIACFMRVWSMLTTLFFALEWKFALKIESNAWETNREAKLISLYSVVKKCEKHSTSYVSPHTSFAL